MTQQSQYARPALVQRTDVGQAENLDVNDGFVREGEKPNFKGQRGNLALVFL